MVSESCDTQNISSFISSKLDLPTITEKDIQTKKFKKKIVISKYSEGCGIMGCTHFIFIETKKSCFNFLGDYHGTLISTNKLKNDFPSFELSFTSGHKMIIYFDPKTKKYTEK
jgi:hypothetical protein